MLTTRAIRGLGASLMLLFYASSSFADPIDSYIRAEMANQHIPGLALAVIRDGFVDDRLDVIVLVNSDNARPDAVAVEVANHFIPGLSPERKTIILEPAALAEYAGRYQVTPSNIVTIAVDGPGLSIQSSEGGAEARMLPETPSVFFISKDESYVFTREAGKVSELEIRFGTAHVVGATEAKAQRLP